MLKPGRLHAHKKLVLSKITLNGVAGVAQHWRTSLKTKLSTTVHVALIILIAAVAMYSQSMSSMLISSSRAEGVTTFVVKAVSYSATEF